MIGTKAPRWPETAEVRIGDATVTVAVRVSARARHYRLSIPHVGGPVLSVPRDGRWREAEAFLGRQAGWLAARLKRAATPVPFRNGAVMPLRGEPHLILATGKVRGQVRVALDANGPCLLVPGDPEHQARRLTDWLKAEAQRDLEARVGVHARTLEVSVRSVRLRAQTTRWGSCASSGRLNFNWRLILAPGFVLDYVAAHEVAHLVEMNHSPAFWTTVERALPDMAHGRSWLKAHGRQLLVFGVDG